MQRGVFVLRRRCERTSSTLGLDTRPRGPDDKGGVLIPVRWFVAPGLMDQSSSWDSSLDWPEGCQQLSLIPVGQDTWGFLPLWGLGVPSRADEDGWLPSDFSWCLEWDCS